MSPTTCMNAQRSLYMRQGKRSLPPPEPEKMHDGLRHQRKRTRAIVSRRDADEAGAMEATASQRQKPDPRDRLLLFCCSLQHKHINFRTVPNFHVKLKQRAPKRFHQRSALESPEFAATTPTSLPELPSSLGKATESPFRPSTISSIFLNWYGHLLLYRNCL
ncbi:hypothetical protein DY000_02010576 [Brassica cretica]|uniref:Uncharacterized protein n=1 Tax=Brassica cretica TaxID=69181 RepID=A0ABQ7CLK6_BRACR|nr:hypothetical protein DY000_02010576 [Brassica cretica]